MSATDRRTVHRACTLCEAHCGLTIEVEDLVGQSILNGIRVELAAVEQRRSAVA